MQGDIRIAVKTRSEGVGYDPTMLLQAIRPLMGEAWDKAIGLPIKISATDSDNEFFGRTSEIVAIAYNIVSYWGDYIVLDAAPIMNDIEPGRLCCDLKHILLCGLGSLDEIIVCSPNLEYAGANSRHTTHVITSATVCYNSEPSGKELSVYELTPETVKPELLHVDERTILNKIKARLDISDIDYDVFKPMYDSYLEDNPKCLGGIVKMPWLPIGSTENVLGKISGTISIQDWKQDNEVDIIVNLRNERDNPSMALLKFESLFGNNITYTVLRPIIKYGRLLRFELTSYGQKVQAGWLR